MSDLKMVNGKTYIDARVNGGEPVRLGDIVTVDDPKTVKDLLGLTFTDHKDNTRHYFRDVTRLDEEEEDAIDEPVLEDAPGDEAGIGGAKAADSEDKAEARPARRGRTAKQ